jgi:hypothetical protein
MVRGTNTKGVVGLAVFLVTAAVIGAPTRSDCEQPLLSGYVGSDLSPDALACANRHDVTGPSMDHFPGVMGEFHRAAVSFSGLSMGARRTKSLAPAPGTMFLSLVGLLCVLAARDRDLWLAAMGNLVQACRAGLRLFSVSGWHVTAKECGGDGWRSHGFVSRSKSEWPRHLPNGLERVFRVDAPGQRTATGLMPSLSSRRLPASHVLWGGSAVEHGRRMAYWSDRTGTLTIARYRGRLKRGQSGWVRLTGLEMFATRRAAFHGELPHCWIRALVAAGSARGPPAYAKPVTLF